MASELVSIPKLDFSLLDSGASAVWDSLQSQMMHALESYGCFEVEYDRVTSELRHAFFNRALPELFGLPVDTKLLNKCDDFLDGYIGGVPHWAYESLRISEDVGKFTSMLWPQGNHTFCDTVSTYTKHMITLEQIIVRMIFLALGIEKYYDSYIKSARYETQVIEYGIPLDQGGDNGLVAHFDQNLVSIVCRNLIKGLEIQTKEGEWVPIVPSPNSFTVIIGEAMQAWTNGRLQAPLHRVIKNNANEKRYTISTVSIPRHDYVIQTPKELVDREQPKPFVYQDHVHFRYPEPLAGVWSSRFLSCDTKEEELQAVIGISDSPK